MCNQFRIPNLKQMSEYLTQSLDLPLIPPDFSDEEKDVFPKAKSPCHAF